MAVVEVERVGGVPSRARVGVLGAALGVTLASEGVLDSPPDCVCRPDNVLRGPNNHEAANFEPIVDDTGVVSFELSSSLVFSSDLEVIIEDVGEELRVLVLALSAPDVTVLAFSSPSGGSSMKIRRGLSSIGAIRGAIVAVR